MNHLKQYFHEELLVVVYMKPQCVTIQMNAIEQYFHEVMFIMLYKVVINSFLSL